MGGGYKPYLYDVNLTPMLFRNNQQLVFSLQANNVGQEQESQFNIIDVSEGIVSGLDLLKPRYVMVSRVPSPSIAMDRYYDNNSQYASLKCLIKMKVRWETKVDANYYSNLSYRTGIVNRTYFFADSSVNYFETSNTNLKIIVLDLELGLHTIQAIFTLILKPILQGIGTTITQQ